MLRNTKHQVINLGNCCIWLVNLFELYDNARTCQRQKDSIKICSTDMNIGVWTGFKCQNGVHRQAVCENDKKIFRCYKSRGTLFSLDQLSASEEGLYCME